MKNFYIIIFLISYVTLMTEILLTRVFDVLFSINMSYMIITSAIFSFGLAGIYATLIKLPDREKITGYVLKLTLLLAISIFAILPALNWIPFNSDEFDNAFILQAFYFLVMYAFVVIPFFLSGLIITVLISSFPEKIQTLYFWDLSGAALGCIILIPFLPAIGPGGLFLVGSGLLILVSGLFSGNRKWQTACLVIGIAVIATPFAYAPKYFDFYPHHETRGLKKARKEGKTEFTRWDPISKIDVVHEEKSDFVEIFGVPIEEAKHIVYDGGTQSSLIYPFDGDFQNLRINLHSVLQNHFPGIKALASHYLKRDSDQRVLVIGCAGGQEIKASLMYGAAHIDAVEMVETVVNLGKKRYSEYNGNIFNHPKVNAHVGEGRSYLRSTQDKYDIIQIYSNHTSSSIAAGTGAMTTVYLQTVEAYKEYFTHLTNNGVVHINHYFYPRMVTTAAKAWKELGLADFQKHVVVFELEHGSVQPTLLIKMKPWTQDEVNDLKTFFNTLPRIKGSDYKLVENPLHPDESFLSTEFYSGRLSSQLKSNLDYRVTPTTDNRPFFSFLRKTFKKVKPEASRYLNRSNANIMNSQLLRFFSKDTIHLIITGIVGLFFAMAFVLIPLYFSKIGRGEWPFRARYLAYFSFLGCGFIIFELVFIQIFMQFIGFPLYTFATIIFVMLLSAGIGSYSSEKLEISLEKRWPLPFIGIILTSIFILIAHSTIFHFFLASPLFMRVLVTSLLIFPLGFFLGMPFPLGILSIQNQPKGAIAWAWALNGLFTVIGGFLGVLLSLYFGFRMTLLVAIGIYVLAFIVLATIKIHTPKLVLVSD